MVRVYALCLSSDQNLIVARAAVCRGCEGCIKALAPP